MLKSHFDAQENKLLYISKIPENAGHALHKGTPREAFIREFLEDHLNKKVSVGTGEIIDHTSEPNPKTPRNQFDLVIFDNNYPKLNFGGGIDAFLAESVVATIEVKSTLTREGIQQAVQAATYAKSLNRSTEQSFEAGFIPPTILNYLVAYAGPAKVETIHDWIQATHADLKIHNPVMSDTMEERLNIPSPSIDGVFVLGKGFISFDNSPLSFCSEARRQANPETRWILVKCQTGSLLYLFILLLQATLNIQGTWLDPLPYLENFLVDETLLGEWR
jgi:hypothetical protein